MIQPIFSDITILSTAKLHKSYWNITECRRRFVNSPRIGPLENLRQIAKTNLVLSVEYDNIKIVTKQAFITIARSHRHCIV